MNFDEFGNPIDGDDNDGYVVDGNENVDGTDGDSTKDDGTKDDGTDGDGTDGDGTKDDGTDGDGTKDDGTKDGDTDDDPDKANENETKASTGKHASERIQKLVTQKKELEKSIEDLTRENKELQSKFDGMDENDVQKILSETGILPLLLTKENVECIKKMQEAKYNYQSFRKMLSSNEDIFKIGGKELSRRELQLLVDDWRDDHESLSRKAQPIIDSLKTQGKDIMAMGLAAKKAGYKPGDKFTLVKTDPAEDKGKTKTKSKNRPSVSSPPSSNQTPNQKPNAAKGSGKTLAQLMSF